MRPFTESAAHLLQLMTLRCGFCRRRQIPIVPAIRVESETRCCSRYFGRMTPDFVFTWGCSFALWGAVASGLVAYLLCRQPETLAAIVPDGAAVIQQWMDTTGRPLAVCLLILTAGLLFGLLGGSIGLVVGMIQRRNWT